MVVCDTLWLNWFNLLINRNPMQRWECKESFIKNFKPKVHTIRSKRSCISYDSCILCGFYYKLQTMRFMRQVLCCCGQIISNFGKNGKSNCDFKRIYRINYIFMHLHTYVCIWYFELLRPTKCVKRTQDKCFQFNYSPFFWFTN